MIARGGAVTRRAMAYSVSDAATLTLALRLLARDWRAGELRVLIAAIVLAVASVGTVGFFADRVKAGLAQQANLLLGADLMISGDRPLPATFADEARSARTRDVAGDSIQQHGAAGGRRRQCRAHRRQGGRERLSVARRDLARRTAAAPEQRDARGIPARGEAWIDVRLADRLGAQKGTKLAVGEATLTVTAIIAQDPEIAGLTFAPGPKLLLNLDDLPATKLSAAG